MLSTSRLPGSIPVLAVLVGVMALALVTLVFVPGLHGPFLFDDFSNLLLSPGLHAYAEHRSPLWPVLMQGVAGPLGRPVAVLSLAWQVHGTGFEAFPFKVFNLAVHLVNTVLVFLFSLQLLRIAGGHARCWDQPPAQTGLAPPTQPPGECNGVQLCMHDRTLQTLKFLDTLITLL